MNFLINNINNINSTKINKANPPLRVYGHFYNSSEGDSVSFRGNSANKESLLERLFGALKNIKGLKTSSKKSAEPVSFCGIKKKADSSRVIDPKDVNMAKQLEKYYIDASKYDLKEMELALELIDKKLAKRIRETGDLFTDDEIFDLQDLYDFDKSSAFEIIESFSGNFASGKRINIDSNLVDARYQLKEYVERAVNFTNANSQKLELSTQKVDALIDKFGEQLSYRDELYRGVLDDSEIARLFYLLDKKRKHPESTVIYAPRRLTSTTRTKAVTEKTYASKCMLNIQIPKDTLNPPKGLDINHAYEKLRLGKNAFAFQDEVLFPSNVRFEIKRMEIIDGIPNFILEVVS